MTGPIDFQQLQLENAELIDVLRSKNAQVKRIDSKILWRIANAPIYLSATSSFWAAKPVTYTAV